MKRCRLVSVVKLTTFLTPYDHVLITCCLSFRFLWERILFLKSACVNVVMQIQVQIGDTRRVFLCVNPPGSVEDLKNTTFLREIPKTRFMDFGIPQYFTKTIKENM